MGGWLRVRAVSPCVAVASSVDLGLDSQEGAARIDHSQGSHSSFPSSTSTVAFDIYMAYLQILGRKNLTLSRAGSKIRWLLGVKEGAAQGIIY